MFTPDTDRLRIAAAPYSITSLSSRFDEVQFRLDPGDRARGDGPSQERAEYRYPTSMPFGRDIWMSDAFRVVRYVYEPGNKFVIIDQFRYTSDPGDRSSLSPELAVLVRPSTEPGCFRLQVVTRSDSDRHNTRRADHGDPPGGYLNAHNTPFGGSAKSLSPGTTVRLDITLRQQQWQRIVACVRFSRGGEGALQLWLNGTKVFDGRIPVGYARRLGPRHEFGAYGDAHENEIVIQHADHEFGLESLFRRVADPLPLPE